jgi:hypothetical protein
VRVLTMDSAVLGLASSGSDCCTVCVFGQKLTLERMPSGFTPLLLRLKRCLPCVACGQWHSSRVFTASYRFTL